MALFAVYRVFKSVIRLIRNIPMITEKIRYVTEITREV